MNLGSEATGAEMRRLLDLASVGGDLPSLGELTAERDYLRMVELGAKLRESVLTVSEQAEYESLQRRCTGGGHLDPFS